MSCADPIAVVGAGVIGLAIADRLLAAGFTSVTVIADHWSPHTTSDGAGALWEQRCDEHATLAQATLQHYNNIVESGAATEAGVSFVDGAHYSIDATQYDSFASSVKSFKFATNDELATVSKRTGVKIRSGVHWRSIIVDSPTYLNWLLDRIQRAGGVFVHQHLASLAELSPYFRTVVNASGLGARELAGDSDVYPARGQVVRVFAPHITSWSVVIGPRSIDEDKGDVCTYVLPRLTSGVAICGGTFQPHNEDASISPVDDAVVWSRCCALEPALLDARTVVLDKWTGLRPIRSGDVRIELDASGPMHIVHAYGHGGCGHSLHWGTALQVVPLVRKSAEILQQQQQLAIKMVAILPFSGHAPDLERKNKNVAAKVPQYVSTIAEAALPREVSNDELSFLASWTRETDFAVLRSRLAQVHAAATSPAGGGAHEYRCVREMRYLVPRLPLLADYAAILAAGVAARSKGETPLWVDVGCGLGVDVRKLNFDGWPSENIVAVDISPTLWLLGFDLFRDSASPPCRFVTADLAQPISPESTTAVMAAVCTPGTATVISLMAVLHVLSAPQVTALLCSARTLLAPGGSLVGVCAGAAVGAAGMWTPPASLSVPTTRWLHDVDTLSTELTTAGFTNVAVTEHDRSSHSELPVSVAAPAQVTRGGVAVFLRFSANRPMA